MKEMIKAEGLYKTYKLSKKQQKKLEQDENIKIAVNNISFSVYKGEVFGLLGPNGAGKTTTLRMLATLIMPDRGTAIVQGKNVITEASSVRENIGFLTSDLQLDGFSTPNYLFDFFSDLYNIELEEREKRKQMLFHKFGIDEFAETKVSALSTGMKQKVSLAISLVNNPEIIIFDEPTNGLDIVAAKTVTDFLYEMKMQGKTIIISTHIFSLIEKICDRVAIMINGEIRCDKKMEDILQSSSLEDKFFEIYNDNFGGKDYR